MNPIETPIKKPRKQRVKKDTTIIAPSNEIVQEVEINKSEVKNEVKEPKTRKPNPWLLYTKKIQTENPDLSYKAVLSLAKASYKK
jgi:hypothetical protein